MSEPNKNEPAEVVVAEAIASEIVAPTANVLESQERASIDTQIATAKKYPRSISLFTKKAVAMATVDEETAESCIYRRPVGKDKSGQMTFAEGLSVRMAEIVGESFGNLRVACRVVEQTERYVKAQGVAHDLESNYLATAEIIEPTIDKWGKPYNERMRIVIAKAALAKARRDAIFAVVPRALAKPVERAVREVLYGDAKSLSKRRALVGGWIAKLGIEEDRVFTALGIAGLEEMNEKELETLSGLKTAIRDGDITIDEAFPRKTTAAATTEKSPLETPPAEKEKKDKEKKSSNSTASKQGDLL